MQITNTVCDVCIDAGVTGSVGDTVDLSWLQPGYEIDICEAHLAELMNERTKLANVWLKSARRSLVAKPQPPQRGSTGVNVPGFGVEGQDWVWAKGHTRRHKVINKKCPNCERTFVTRAAYSQHVRTHDSTQQAALAGQLDSASPSPPNVAAQEGSNDHTHAM